MAKTIDIIVAGKYTGQDALGKAKRDVDGLETGAKKAGGGFRSAATTIGAAAVGIGVALGAVTAAAKLAWDELARGAQLNRTADQFSNLAGSINSTADALLGKMRDATRGMMTDAQLMASGVEIMSLGLGNTEDEVVRLATVIGELGWDMQQVILTMANNSKMRLDALGLSVEDVTERAKKLEEAGMSMDQAFDLAVIEAGEEKIKLLGSAADTTAGQMQMLITEFGNARDAFSSAFAEELADDLGLAAGNAEALGDGLSTLAGTLAGLAAGPVGEILRELALAGQIQAIKDLVVQYDDLGGAMEGIANLPVALSMGQGVTWITDVEQGAEVIAALTLEVDKLRGAAMHSIPNFIEPSAYEDIQVATQAVRDYGDATDAVRRQLDAYYAIGERAANVNRQIAEETGYTKYELAQMGMTAEEVMQQQQEAAEAQIQALEDLKQGYREAGLAMGAAFSAALGEDAMPDFSDVDAMKQSAFDMATAFGLTAPILADIGVQMGVIDSATAEAAGKAAIFAGAMDVLLGKLSAGLIDPTQFSAAVEQLITDLENNTVVDLQVNLTAKEDAVQSIRDMSWLPEAAQDAMIANMDLEITVADEALQDALGLIDGIPDNDEKIVTFTPEARALVDEIEELETAIANIPGEVEFTPNATLVDDKIRELSNTRVTVYVDYVPAGTPPPSPNGGPPAPAPRGGSGTSRGGRSWPPRPSVPGLYDDIRREGVPL